MSESAGRHRDLGRDRDLTLVLVGLLALVLVALAVWGGAHATSQAAQASSRRGLAAQAAEAAKANSAAATSDPVVLRPGDLQRNPTSLRKLRRAAAKQALEEREVDITFRIGSFNILGEKHTRPGGAHAGWPSAAARTPRQAAYILGSGVDVVGLQEAKASQLSAMVRLTGFKAFPGFAFGARDTDNSILYNPKRFEFVSGTSFPITFMHAVRPQTVLKLREKVTGQEMYFINMHPSAGHDRRNTATRVAGHLRGVAEVKKLLTEGLPLFVTGDMNDRAAFFCRFLPPTGLHAAVGGNTDGGCHPPGRLQVDWVLGSGQVDFSGYVFDGRPQSAHLSDHFYVHAQATVHGHTSLPGDDADADDTPVGTRTARGQR